MIRAISLLALAAVPAAAQLTKASVPAGSPPPVVGTVPAKKVALSSLLPIERQFNQQFSTLFDQNERLDLLGLARSVYLEGYGAVFTAELSLVVTPTRTPFMQAIPPQMASRVRQLKMDRLPVLRKTMKEMMTHAARALPEIPETQQVVLSVRFLYEPWENRSGMPSQILMRADRKAAMAGEIQVEEQ